VAGGARSNVLDGRPGICEKLAVGSRPVGSNPVGSIPVGKSPVGSKPVGATPVANPLCPHPPPPPSVRFLYHPPGGNAGKGRRWCRPISLSSLLCLLGLPWRPLPCGAASVAATTRAVMTMVESEIRMLERGLVRTGALHSNEAQ
jgi:hypothetical protein